MTVTELELEIPADHKRCPKCGEVKPRVSFYRNQARSGGFSYACKDCARANPTHKASVQRSKQRERDNLAADLAALAEARTGWLPGMTMTGFDGLGCPECAGPLELVAPSVPSVWHRTWVLNCKACGVSFVLEQRLGRLR